jgi:hypothetical protein
MTHPSRSVLRTVAIAGAIVVGVVAAVVAASVVVFPSRYVQKEDVGPDSAAREFEQVRSRFASRLTRRRWRRSRPVAGRGRYFRHELTQLAAARVDRIAKVENF